MKLVLVTTQWGKTGKEIWTKLLCDNWDNIKNCSSIKKFVYAHLEKEDKFKESTQLFEDIQRFDFIINDYVILTLLQQGSEEINTEFAKKVMSSFPNYEVYIAEHIDGGKVKKKELELYKPIISEFVHSHREPNAIYISLSNLISKFLLEKGMISENVIKNQLQGTINPENINIDETLLDLFNSLMEEIKKKQPVVKLSLLKHRISHLWLPLDIDIQGIMECWSGGKEDATQNYLKEALEDKKDKAKDQNGNPTYYRQKLAKLWYMVVHKPENDLDKEAIEFSQSETVSRTCRNLEIKCKTVSPGNEAKTLLVDNKAILELVCENDKKDTVKDNWEKLLKICGLCYNKSNPYSKNEIKAEPTSAILKFMCYLDYLIQNRENIMPATVEELFKKGKEFFELLNTELKTLNSTLSVDSFHLWFCALDDCLDRLREAIKN
jgi:hypothetical protein